MKIQNKDKLKTNRVRHSREFIFGVDIYSE